MTIAKYFRKSPSLSFLKFLLDITEFMRKKNLSLPYPMYVMRFWLIRCGSFMMIVTSALFCLDKSIADNLQVAVILFSSIHIFAKHLLLDRGDLAWLVDKAEKLYDSTSSVPGSRPVWEGVDGISLKFGRLYCFMILVYIPLNLASSGVEYFIKGNVHLPFPLWTPPMGLVLLEWLFQVWVIFPSMLVQIAFSISLYILIKHATGNMKILQMMIANQDKRRFQLHADIITYCSKVNGVYGGLLVLEIYFATAQCCFCGYQIIKALEANDPRLAFFTVFLVQSLIQPFILCGCGQEILNESEALNRTEYESQWYERTPSERRDDYFLMLASTKCLSLQYKHFTTFDMERFGMVLQSAYTYMMVLKSINL